jgi:CheY-like chemotaxis protein
LVVDDEPMIAEDLCESLEESGYKVFLPSHSGADAIRQVQQGEPDLVLMDINLKGDLDGISTAQAIQKIHDCAIIYLTANADSQTLQRAKMTSPFGYIIKPFRERGIACPGRNFALQTCPRKTRTGAPKSLFTDPAKHPGCHFGAQPQSAGSIYESLSRKTAGSVF